LKTVMYPPADKLTAFRLPQPMLTTVDSFCQEQDLTRSQFYRRCILNYLKQQAGSPEYEVGSPLL
jgi:hypothetical protein